jgi:biopolymer transport protein ExbD
MGRFRQGEGKIEKARRPRLGICPKYDIREEHRAMLEDMNSDEDKIVASINVTPLVDIILVMLIIFMITSHFLKDPVIPVELPQAANVEEGKVESFALVLDKEGKLYVNGRESTRDSAAKTLQTAYDRNPEVSVIIAADGKVRHESVIWLIDLVKSTGITRFALQVKKYVKEAS